MPATLAELEDFDARCIDLLREPANVSGFKEVYACLGDKPWQAKVEVGGQKNNISGCDIYKTNSIPLSNACPNEKIAPIGRFQVHSAPKLRPAEGHKLFY